jgi:hypothetical protein
MLALTGLSALRAKKLKTAIAVLAALVLTSLGVFTNPNAVNRAVSAVTSLFEK